MPMSADSLKNREHNIYIFGPSEELSCAAVSLLWFLGLSPAAFIDENVQKEDRFLFGIPILSLQDALAHAETPAILLCSYNVASCQSIMEKVNRFVGKDVIFWSPYDIELAYAKEKRSGASLSKLQPLMGTDVFKLGTLSRYTCSVERDYESMLKDIRQVAAYSPAIKYLEIRTPSDLIDDEFTGFLELVCAIDNILYISIKTDSNCEIAHRILEKIKLVVLKIDFCRDPALVNHVPVDLNGLIGQIPFSYAEKDGCSLQTRCYDERPLTLAHLRNMIADDLGITLAEAPADNREICFVTVCGGLGNQILYYLAACLISEYSSKLIIIDDTKNQVIASCSEDTREKILQLRYDSLNREDVQKALQAEKAQTMFLYEHLELYDIFSCNLTLFSELFDPPIWAAILNKLDRYATRSPLFSYLSSLNCKMTYYSDRYTYNRSTIYAKNYISIDKYFMGPPNPSEHFWLTAPMKNSYYYLVTLTNFQFWNARNRAWARTKLKFPSIQDEYNQKLAVQIKESNPVVLHVRRGDMYYLNASSIPRPEAYYQAAIAAIRALDQFSPKKWFVFSDEIAWCQDHRHDLGLDLISDDMIVYAHQNTGKASFRDMQLLSMGKIMVFPPVSSFSFCAFILSDAVEKYVSYQNYKALYLSNLSADEIQSRLIQDAR